jgi:hypothetical protein
MYKDKKSGKMIKDIRVKAENGEILAAALREAGFEGEWLGCGTAHGSLHNGCGEEECCPQHPARNDAGSWGAIRTNIGGNKAHRIWLALGLVEKW